MSDFFFNSYINFLSNKIENEKYEDVKKMNKRMSGFLSQKKTQHGGGGDHVCEEIFKGHEEEMKKAEFILRGVLVQRDKFYGFCKQLLESVDLTDKEKAKVMEILNQMNEYFTTL